MSLDSHPLYCHLSRVDHTEDGTAESSQQELWCRSCQRTFKVLVLEG